jgi:hypothetical protein
MFIVVPELGFKPDYKYPFMTRMTYHPLRFNSIFRSLFTISISLLYLEDDQGWIIESKNNSIDIDMSLMQTEMIYLDEEDKFPQVQFMIDIHDRYKKYIRSYAKFQDVLAVIGGFMKLILSVMNICLFYAKTYLIDMHILKIQFNHKPVRIGKISDSELPTLNISNQSNLINLELVNNYLNVKGSNATKEFKKINIFTYTKALIMNLLNLKYKPDKRINNLRDILKEVDNLQDYDMILKKLNELEIMKKVIFNKEQLLCFEFLEKPHILQQQNSSISNKDIRMRENLISYFSLLSEDELKGYNETFFNFLEHNLKIDIMSKNKQSKTPSL